MKNNESHKDKPHTDGRLLAAVGMTAFEERTYLLLLDQPGLTIGDLAALLDSSERSVCACLAQLENAGLVARSSDGNGYRPAPPDVVIKSLVARKVDDLHRTERLADRLLQRSREAAARRRGREDVLEFVTGEQALSARLDQLQHAVQQEVLGFVTVACPYRAPQRTFERARARGVRIRLVYDRKAIEAPGMLETARQQVARGGHVRVAVSLPVTVAIFDRRLALVPELDGVQGAMVVGPSAVLDALVAFCESTWEHASPLKAAWNDASVESAIPEHDDLIALLSAGLKDEAIARRLGLSTRTLDRRVRALMKTLPASTRFQAGWMAAHRATARET